MRFEEAVRHTPDLEDAYKPGLQALRPVDGNHVSATNPRSIAGSVDLDAALRPLAPNSPVWDYGVAQRAGRDMERVFWIEIHPATTGEINSVLAKLEWLKGWLRNDGTRLDGFDREFVWVASGRTALRPGAQQTKRMAAMGLRFAGGHLRL